MERADFGNEEIEIGWVSRVSTRGPPGTCFRPPPQSSCGSRAGSSSWRAIATTAPAQARRAAMCTFKRVRPGRTAER
eukprot:3762140-Pleurochrysis_carterae.AAC.2